MILTNVEIFILILIMSFVTFCTRLFPFLFFNKNKNPSAFVTYLGKYLPFAMIAMLVVYCLKDVNFFSYQSLLPEIISIGVIVFLHVWKKNFFISMGMGTFLYMFLVQTIF